MALPIGVWRNILNRLDTAEDFGRAAQVCKATAEAARSLYLLKKLQFTPLTRDMGDIVYSLLSDGRKHGDTALYFMRSLTPGPFEVLRFKYDQLVAICLRGHPWMPLELCPSLHEGFDCLHEEGKKLNDHPTYGPWKGKWVCLMCHWEEIAPDSDILYDYPGPIVCITALKNGIPIFDPY